MTGIEFAPDTASLVLLVGLLLSLVLYLTTRLSPGGLIVPGWLALTIVEGPKTIVLTVATTALTIGALMLLRRYTLLFGKRLFAATVLIGGAIMETAFLVLHAAHPWMFPGDTVGFIVPGLIAYQLVRQPVIPTLTALSVATFGSAAVTILAVVVA